MKLRVIVITQSDSLVIPKNIALLVDSGLIEILQCVVINTSSSLVNNRLLFIKGFGLVASAKMFLLLAAFYILDKLYRATRGRFFRDYRSIKTLCRDAGVSYFETKDVNSPSSLSRIRSQSPDVIMSYSAPVVFRDDLLSIPKYGCLNLHCSKIPKFCGVMSSFWALNFGANETGVTVHLMDDKIDNGAIIAQQEVGISDDETMLSLIKKTKLAGGYLALSVLTSLARHNRLPEFIPVCDADREYYSWPTADDLREFKLSGGKLL